MFMSVWCNISLVRQLFRLNTILNTFPQRAPSTSSTTMQTMDYFLNDYSVTMYKVALNASHSTASEHIIKMESTRELSRNWLSHHARSWCMLKIIGLNKVIQCSGNLLSKQLRIVSTNWTSTFRVQPRIWDTTGLQLWLLTYVTSIILDTHDIFLTVSFNKTQKGYQNVSLEQGWEYTLDNP